MPAATAEYSYNGCGRLQCLNPTSQQVYNYELLLRRIARRAPSAAMLSFAIFNFRSYAGGAHNPYYSTGAAGSV
jgi:hypothetical protein